MPNLQAAIDNTLRCPKCRRILAGGPGSGCRGPACGRPRTRTEEDLKKDVSDYKKKMTTKYRKLFEQNNPIKYKEVDNKFLREHRKQFQKDLKKEKYVRAPKGLRSKGRVKEVKTIKYKGKKVDVKVLRPVQKGRPPVPMAKNESRRAGGGFKTHALKGRFTEDTISPLHEPTHTMHIYEAEKSPTGKGATVFILHVKDSPTKSHVEIEEHKRAEHREIESTKKYSFKSGTLAKSFVQDRYGIKMKWSKGAKKK